MKVSEKKIFNLTVFVPLVSVLLVSFIFSFGIFFFAKNFLNNKFEQEKETFINSQKQMIEKEVSKVFSLIEYKLSRSNSILQEKVKSEIDAYYELVNGIYNTNKTKTKDEILLIIREVLKNVRLNSENGFLNIYTLDGIAVMLPLQPQYEGSSILSFRDKDNIPYIEDTIELAKSLKQGFYSYYDVSPNKEQNKESYKVNYVKLFEPLGIVLSIGDYIENINDEIKDDILKRASNMTFGKKGYIYVVGRDGTLLAHKDKKLIGTNVFKIQDVNGKYYFKDGFEEAAKNGESYLEYVSHTNSSNKEMYDARKLTYARYNSDFDFVVSAGVYLDDIDNVILVKKKNNEAKLHQFTLYIIILSMVISLIVVFISLGLARTIKMMFLEYKGQVEAKELELYKINSSLEERIQEELNESRKKDVQILQQARFASLGEMIGNIAHQWRQPLSAISTISSGSIIQNQLGLCDTNENITSYEKILGHVKFLSQTIDDFRNYLRDTSNTQVSKFDIRDTFKEVLNIIEVAYKDNKILMNKEFSETPMMCNGISSQLSQVFLNILNNAKDALVLNGIEDKVVDVKLSQVSGKNIITIIDSAGGVPLDIITKIFDPYFTTKHQSQGTGIGLYMSKDIITGKFAGELKVENTTWNYNGKEFKGAKFTIIL